MVSGTIIDPTEKLGITLPKLLLQKIDKNRGDIAHSKYIRRAIESYIKVKERCKQKVTIDSAFVAASN